MFLQWGLLQAVRTEATALYDFFEFDLAITSQDYQLLYSPGEFDRVRMLQTLALDSVDSSFNLNIDSGRWIDMSSWLRSSVLIFGVDEDPGFIANTDMQTDLGKMMGSRAIMVDRYSHSDFGSIEQGNTAQIDNREVDIYGQFSLGLFFLIPF